ncbi:hypothetical protein RVR_4773 [Actinacidiphila reveromycinica]|uniref:Uncharacterized protein n=1 Tax=Actinacidiphila reveromycinica TaxID=659352 RepID=A0A7U3UTW9_9ACTN|nr:hypothetical protein [Streptomyces sp. SN-593]BBA98551.1 hypothetical protein RVR_4773 [Streptomyces sp. SN-593]
MGSGEHYGAAPRARIRVEDGPAVAHDRAWAGRLWSAYGAAATVLAVALVTDGWDGTLDVPRLAACGALALALFAILLPARTSAGDGWLDVRGLLRGRRVHTGYLVSARFLGEIDRRVVLRDAFGGRVSVEVRVLVANPFLWHELDRGARRSHAAGLLQDRDALRELAEAIDAAGARDLLTSAGMR